MFRRACINLIVGATAGGIAVTACEPAPIEGTPVDHPARPTTHDKGTHSAHDTSSTSNGAETEGPILEDDAPPGDGTSGTSGTDNTSGTSSDAGAKPPPPPPPPTPAPPPAPATPPPAKCAFADPDVCWN